MSYSNSQMPEHDGEVDLDERLAAYYGPPLPEQKLASSSWRQVQRKLGRVRGGRHVRRWHWYRGRPARTMTPFYIEEALERITLEARVPYRASLLHCTFRHRARRSTVRVSQIRKEHIRLTLPDNAMVTMPTVQLDILLATGLARYLLSRHGRYPLLRLALYALLLVGVVVVLFAGWQQRMLIGLPIAIVCWCAALFLLDWQRRKMALAADGLAVRWLGRRRACEGLHALAQQERRPARRHWGEPALTERIARVCGSEVHVHDERLTLVR